MKLSVDRRIKRLGMWNRIMIFTFGVFIILFTTKGCMIDSSVQTLRCKQLEVIDQNGNVIAMIGVDPDGSCGLFIYDEQNRMRVATIHDSTQSAFYALDEAGAIRVGLAQYSHGGGGLALHGEASKGGAVLYYKNGGSLSFYTPEGETIMHIPEKK
jgi:hypothetical protein